MEIKPIDREVIDKIMDLIGDAEIMDGSPIDADKVTGVTIRKNTVTMLQERPPYGSVMYYTCAPWDFFVNALKNQSTNRTSVE